MVSDRQSGSPAAQPSADSWRDTARAGVVLGLVSLACRLVSLVKEVVVAYLLGAGTVTDAYALVMLIPGFATSLFWQAARSAFLAQYAACREIGSEAERHFRQQYLVQLAFLSVLVAGIGGGGFRFLWPVLFPWATDELRRTVMLMFWPASALVITYAVITGLTAVLNAHRQFVVPQWTSTIPTLAVLAWLVCGTPQTAARALVEGLLYGTLVQMGLLFWWTHCRIKLPLAHSHIPISSRHHALAWWRLAIPIALANVATQVNSYVDRMMASSLEQGAIAVLSWAGLLRDLIAGTLIGGFVGVWLPHFAEQLTARRFAEAGQTMSRLLRGGAVVLLPASILLAVAAPIAGHQFRLGRLTEDAAARLAACFAAYAVGFYADLASNSLYQVLIALRRTRILVMYAIFVNVVPNILLNLLLIRLLGAAGLALATSIVGYCTLVANHVAVQHALLLDGRRVLETVCWAVALSVSAGCFAWWIGERVSEWLSPMVFAGPVAAVVSLCCGVGAYGALAFVTPLRREIGNMVMLIYRWRVPGEISPS